MQVPEAAAELGDQPMLEWVSAQDPPVPWNPKTCAAAARRGDITMLAWLGGQKPPCPWDELATAAAATKNIATLQWLRSQQPPCPWGCKQLCSRSPQRAAGNPDLVEGPAPTPAHGMGSALRPAVSQPDVEVLQWLHEAGMPI